MDGGSSRGRADDSAEVVDAAIRRHLSMLLVAVQGGDDQQVARLARAETHRLIGGVVAGLRWHPIVASGNCGMCAAARCALRCEISHALMPVAGPGRELGR